MRIERLLVCVSGLLLSCCAAGQGSGGAAVPPARQMTEAAHFSQHVLAARAGMPTGGGYAADRAAEVRLAEHGIVWQGSGLRVSPDGASPTFCSAACYIVLLRALRTWEAASGKRFSENVWHALRVETTHRDGYLSWGRVNANGPGLAKWVHDLDAGVNFTDPAAARPGDFLKYFHSPAIGAHERGHLVIFLGSVVKDGRTYMRCWSSNRSGGYGERLVLLSAVHHPIFTRITRPERVALAPQLPEHDPWLADMLTRDVPYAEVVEKCGVQRVAK